MAHQTEPLHWPLPDMAAGDSSVIREIRITQDYGLGGEGPTIRIVVDHRGTRGEVYVTHWVAASTDSEDVAVEKTMRDDRRKRYGCTSFMSTKDQAVCRVPYRQEPNWEQFVARLDSLLATAPPSPPPDPNLVCLDGSAWAVTDRRSAMIRSDASRYCGPGSPERKRYEAAVWELLLSIDHHSK